MARGDVRIAVTLACEECKRRNYQTNKCKRNNPDRIRCASTAGGAAVTRRTGRPARTMTRGPRPQTSQGSAARAQAAAGARRTVDSSARARARRRARPDDPRPRARHRPAPTSPRRRRRRRDRARGSPRSSTTSADGQPPVGELSGRDESTAEDSRRPRAPSRAPTAPPAPRRSPPAPPRPRRRAARARPASSDLPRATAGDELQRVQWPDRRQVAQATAVVPSASSIIAGAYLGLADWVFGKIVDSIL